MKPWAGRCASSPVCPNPEIEQTMSSGRRVRRLGEIDAEALQASRPRHLDHDVGRVDQPEQSVAISRIVNVECDALLVSVEEFVPHADAVDERRDGAQVVTRPGILDLHDLGAEVGEVARREATDDESAEIEDSARRRAVGTRSATMSPPLTSCSSRGERDQTT